MKNPNVEKWRQAWEMREAGHTYASIGRHFGITGGHAKVYCIKYQRTTQSPEWNGFWSGLSTQATRLFRAYLQDNGWEWENVTKELAKEAIGDGVAFSEMPNVGPVILKEVCEYLGVEEPEPMAHIQQVEKSIAYLEAMGYTVVPPS